jgi:predicted 2-oxoglutarate/Fe(II)-dependent dioxygenase YbiX
MEELAPGIIQYDFSEDLALRIVDEARSLNIWKKSTLLNLKEQSPLRTSQDANFDRSFSAEVVREANISVGQYIDSYRQRYVFAGITQNETIGILRYFPGEWYDTHADASWQVNRVASMIIYLNPSEYEGGETWFPEFDLTIKPEKPAAVFFPSSFIYSHQAMPVKTGEKIVLVTWMNDLPRHFHSRTLDYINKAMSLNYLSQE